MISRPPMADGNHQQSGEVGSGVLTALNHSLPSSVLGPVKTQRVLHGLVGQHPSLKYGRRRFRPRAPYGVLKSFDGLAMIR